MATVYTESEPIPQEIVALKLIDGQQLIDMVLTVRREPLSERERRYPIYTILTESAQKAIALEPTGVILLPPDLQIAGRRLAYPLWKLMQSTTMINRIFIMPIYNTKRMEELRDLERLGVVHTVFLNAETSRTKDNKASVESTVKTATPPISERTTIMTTILTRNDTGNLDLQEKQQQDSDPPPAEIATRAIQQRPGQLAATTTDANAVTIDPTGI